MPRSWFSTAFAVVLAGACGSTLAAGGSVTLGTQPSYFQGSFGTGSNIDIWYVPFYAEYRRDDLRLKVTIPYISVSSRGAVISGGTVIGRGTATGSRTTESGLGDIWLEGRYTVLHGSGWTPDLTPYTKFKVATASRSAGLGTGENDYEVGTGLDWAAGTRLYPFATVGYRWVGQPAGLNLRNIFTYEAGASYRVAGSQFLTLMYSGHESAEPGFAAASDAIAAWNYDIRPGTGFQVFGDLGLSSGSPDFGLGVGAHVRY